MQDIAEKKHGQYNHQEHHKQRTKRESFRLRIK